MQVFAANVVRTLFVSICVFTICEKSVAQDQKKQTNSEKVGMADLTADAKDLKHTIITPHLNQAIPKDTNVLWCNTFQLAWNELYDLVGEPIKMDDAPNMVSFLNQRGSSKRDLDEQSYVAVAGLTSEGIYENVQKQLQEKFQGQACPRLLERFRDADLPWVMYAYLFKELPFRWAFERSHGELQFAGEQVDSFGIEKLSNSREDKVKMATQVAIHDYADSDDFVIEIQSRIETEQLILAKVPPKKTLEETIAAVEKRIGIKKPRKMEEDTSFEVPVLNFDLVREYNELYKKTVHTNSRKLGNAEFAIAIQSIRFRLDETGAVLQSDAGMAGATTSAPILDIIFDKPFLILLKRREAKTPYFALWVGNAELLVKDKGSGRMERSN